ncbi:efflux RND transporter permease subunit [Mastigocoleus sp. MO_188.B34]|uniref:efflux RND transporter permease subunit n=1 Tax=Mastigocoleus sp. MO_188.B34 TaxID=3036635 RepID=UPI00260BE8CC|nr:efflux RND transporter permease subunit [Mastigocoleus sp. MO_188.B34]MDJ0696959.1 efflux RND transporter permease subunit [Mastigocoleus sp. MO_188.B34]
MKYNSNSGFSISRISISRHIATFILTLAVIVLGVFSITQIPVDLLPSITYPRIGIRVEAPGVSPEVAIDEITKPLEEAFAATEGVEQVYSRTREGRISLDLFFQAGSDIDQALNDATAAFNRARGRLPETIEAPRIFKFDPSQSPVYEFALTSPRLQGVDLRIFAEEEIARELGVVNGVAGADVSGGVEEEVRINIDLQRLQAFGVGLNDVLDKLENRNQDISGGRILGENSEPLSRTVGRFRSADEIRNLSFNLASNSTSTASALNNRVYLRDFAEIIDGTENQRVFVLLNRKSAVKISIQKQSEANTINVVDGVKARLKQLQASGIIPPEALITTTLDESQFIRNSIANLTKSGLIGTTLAAIAVLLFLGSWRQTFIIVLAIPLATLAAMILMGLFHLSLNIFSLGGLALGVGIVVDNSIVMLENITQGFKTRIEGHLPNYSRVDSQTIIQQAQVSSQEVESALVASTSTNLVTVLPFLLIGGFISLIFNELILTISFAVGASIVVAITVVPMLASRMLAWQFSSNLSKFWLLKKFNNRFDAATNTYTKVLRKILRQRLLTLILILFFLGSGSFWMAKQIPQEILPRINTGQAALFARFPSGTSLEINQKVMTAVDEILLSQPETEYVFSTVGGFLFGTTTIANPQRGFVNITLKPGTDIETYSDRVSKEFEKLNLAGIRLRLFPRRVRGLILSNTPVRGADIDVILQGNDTKSLAQAGRQALRSLDEQVTLAKFRPDADVPESEVQIRPDWERVAAYGLTARNIGETIQTAITGSVPTRLQRANRLVDIRVQLNEISIQAASELESLPLFTPDKHLIRLSDVAKIIKAQAPTEIKRINQRQVFLIAGTLSEGASLSEAANQVDRVLDNLDLPPGVAVIPSSTVASNQELQNSFIFLGALAAFLVFVVMTVQYNSLIDPLVIMFTMPLALAGGIFGLYITQTAIGATVIVGAVLLVGIVVNNAIIMVELANQIRERHGVDRQTAILQAAPQRLRPILMTTITTVLGMFPLALGIGEGSEFLQPLGIVVFSGLSLATLLTLFIIPCFYTLLHDIFSWDEKKMKRIQLMMKRYLK